MTKLWGYRKDRVLWTGAIQLLELSIEVSPTMPQFKLAVHRSVILQLVRRDLEVRYRGSVLGMAWAFLLPLSMLAVYTFVFGIVFKQRWGTGEAQSPADFALMLFAGLLVYSFFGECVSRAPVLILQNPNYVKKVVFPLQLLPLVPVGAALVQMGISVVILAVATLALKGSLPWTIVLFPFAMLPLVFLVLACTWFLSALGVFLRDIGQVVGVAVSVLLYLSPVFFPLSAVPESVQWLVKLNPLTAPIEQARFLLVQGQVPPLREWLLLLVVAILAMALGHAVFRRLRPHFADVL